jgi:Protein of unknown function (DUF2846)
MKISAHRVLLALSLVALSALSLPAQTPSPAFPPEALAPDNTATVYFYRLRNAYAAVLKPSVYCDNNQVARMRNGRFVVYKVAAGEHTFTSTFAGSGVETTLKPGDVYYIRIDMSRPSLIHNARGQLTVVMPDQGKFEVSQLEPAEIEDMKDVGVSTSKH